MQPSSPSLESYYAARALEYDDVYRKPERQADLRAIEQWLPGRLRGATVLEVACGTGYWTQFFAPAAAAVVALDRAPGTLRIARERVRSDTVSFVVGDAYALPARAGCFDAAFAGFWFSHVPIERRGEFVRGLTAALGPGALVVLLDNRYVEGSSTPIAERDAQGNTFQLRTLAGGSAHRVLKNFPSEAELRALVADDGVVEATYTAWPFYWVFEYRVAAT